MNIIPTMYGATPSRMSGMTEEIMKFVASQGKACIHPFNSLPYKYFEGGVCGRERTMEICCKLSDACEEFGIFGISEGTLLELTHALSGDVNRIHVFIWKFDPEYCKWCEIFRSRFPKAIHYLEDRHFG